MLPISDGEYRAAWLVPVTSPPIPNAWVKVVDSRVADFGCYDKRESTSKCLDLGDVAVLPGLVNSHTHLEFSNLKFPIGEPGLRLRDWIGQVVRYRHQAGQESDDRSKAIALGLRESADHCVALVGEIATIGSDLSDFQATLVGAFPAVHYFLEILGLNEQRSRECFSWSANVCNQASFAAGEIELGYSPHAPYSVPMELLRKVIELSCQRRATVAMHVAESLEELDLIERGNGPFAELVERIAPSSGRYFPYPNGLMSVLRELASTPRCLLVHGNYLSGEQIEYISRYNHFSVVYCPRTHHFFGHSPHPVGSLLEKGIRVCLGTDSRASNPDLSIWREAQFLRSIRPDISPAAILRMITIDAATALGREGFGEIAIGQSSRLIQVALPSNPVDADKLMDRLFDEHPKLIG